MGTERPAAWAFADEDYGTQADVPTSGDNSFCIEMNLDDSASIHYDAPASERDAAYQRLAGLSSRLATLSVSSDSGPSALGVVTNKKWANGRTLTVCFFGGSTTLQQSVQNYASQWMQFANIKFHFVAGRSADIRVAFTGRGGRSDSFVGTDNTGINSSLQTMNLGLDDGSPHVDIQRTTLHEFGHALGCIHEHSQPNFNFEWNRQAVIDAHRGIWDQSMVEHNIFFKYNRQDVQSSAFDQFSIMLYPIPGSWTYGRFSSNWNSNLSQTDKAFISAMYPFPNRPSPIPPPQPPPIPPTPVVVPPSMSKTYLPDTALTALAINKDVYTYAQTYKGVVIECHGQLETDESSRPDIYSYTHQNHVVARYRGEHELPGAPKLFTPLAAAYIGSTRYLFYVDDNNLVRGVKSLRTPWPEETGVSGLGVRCASYSQLTAISFSKNNFQAICLYYQTPKKDAGIEAISYSTKNGTWVKGMPDMTPNPPPPPPRVVDPPLYGTSMTAVPTRKDLQIISNSIMPVVYLQWDTLALAHSQEAKIQVIQDLDLRFAPHTSLTTVDDGENLYCFYTSSRNNNIKMISINNGKASPSQIVATPTPRSAIAAVLPTKDRIVLFYQSLDVTAGDVDLVGVTFTKVQTSSTNPLPFVPVVSTKLE